MFYKLHHTVYKTLGLAFFHLMKFIQVLDCINNSLLFMAESYSVAWCTTVVNHHPMMDSWIASSLGLLWIKLFWTFVDRFLWEHEFIFLWDKCPGVQLLGYVVIICLVLWETAKLFFRVLVSVYIPTSNVWWICDHHILASIGWCYYFLVILLAV